MDSSGDTTSGKSCRSVGSGGGSALPAPSPGRAKGCAKERPYCENYRLLRSVGPTSSAWGPRRDSNPRQAV